jgi:hypothetical protein
MQLFLQSRFLTAMEIIFGEYTRRSNAVAANNKRDPTDAGPRSHLCRALSLIPPHISSSGRRADSTNVVG